MTGVVVAVEVVAVERQAGFEPERVARAQPDRLDPVVGDQRFGECLGIARRRPRSRTRPRRCSPSG